MPMEVEILRDENTYFINLGDKIRITTTYARDDSEVKEWINEVLKIYGKKTKHSLVVGFSADRSCGYHNGRDDYDRGLLFVKNKANPRYELLQLCVGNHCLLMDRDHNDMPKQPKCLKDFLLDGKTTIVGVGIRKIVEKLEKETDLEIRYPIELRNLAENRMGEKGRFTKATVESLATAVLGDKMEVPKKPNSNKISWFAEEEEDCEPSWWWSDYLSDDMVKFATLEVYLAARIGSRLLYREE